MLKLTAESIKSLRQFTKAFRERRPNSPIVKGLKVEGSEPVHLTIDDLEALIEVAFLSLPIGEKIKLHEVRRWRFDQASQRVVEDRDAWIEAGL